MTENGVMLSSSLSIGEEVLVEDVVEILGRRGTLSSSSRKRSDWSSSGGDDSGDDSGFLPDPVPVKRKKKTRVS